MVCLYELAAFEKIRAEERTGFLGNRGETLYGVQWDRPECTVFAGHPAQRLAGLCVGNLHTMKKANRYIKKGMIGLATAALFLVPANQNVFAHEGQPPAPHDLWTSWNWDPFILASLLLGAWAYVVDPRSRLSWRGVSYMAGLITLFIAFISPLDALSTALFSAHMVQHMLLIVVFPPLLVWGMSPGGLASPLNKISNQWWRGTSWLKPVWRFLMNPSVVWTQNVLTLWIWHAPGLYQSALENEALHMLEHLTFLITSLLFWWTITRPRVRMGRGDPGILALFTMAMQSGLLGALITFAPTPWYGVYESTTQPWGLSPLEDQQLAGAIMWIPMGAVYTVGALILFAMHLAWLERTSNQREVRIIQERQNLP
jgi:putative membrane protein